MARVLLFFSLLALAGCAAVPQNRRARLADPMMSVTDDRSPSSSSGRSRAPDEPDAPADSIFSGLTDDCSWTCAPSTEKRHATTAQLGYRRADS